MRPNQLACCLATAALALVVQVQTASAQPVQGTYLRTCRNVQVSRDTLSAECADVNGRVRASSIPYRRCNGDIGNNNGMLNCNGASATGGGVVSNNGGPGGYGPGGNGYGNGPGDNRGGYGPGDNRGNGYGNGPGGNGGGYGRITVPGFDVGSYERRTVYPEFQGVERNIYQQIMFGVRDRRIGRDDGRDLMRQLASIQDREAEVMRKHGPNLSNGDRREFQRNLDQLSDKVDRIVRGR